MTFNRRGAGRTGALPLTLSLLIGFAACVGNGDGPSSHAAPEIQVSDHEPLIDEEVQIRVVGLRAHETVVLDLELESAGNRWIAQASYRSDAAGRVDLAVQAPIGGDYAGVDAMGLFWSARLQGALGQAQGGPERANLVARVNGRPVATTTLRRRSMAEGVTSQPVRENGLVGTLFIPPGPGPHPALVLLGGSEGGLPTEGRAGLFASHGYVVFALAYFHPEGPEKLPRQLFEVPIEYFLRALDWLRSQASVNSSRVGVWGASRGAEAALLLSTVDTAVKVVIAVAPSHVLWPSHPTATGSAWSQGDEPLPYVPYAGAEAAARYATGAPPGALVPLFRASLDNAAATEAARIPIERAQAAILLISGRDDQLWPSTDMAERIMETLRAHGYPHPYRHLAYDNAGHILVAPYRPTTNLSSRSGSARGGSAEGSARAAVDQWSKTLQFLNDHLRSG